MTLLIDNRVAMDRKPGVHALVVGVSDYQHLVGHADPAPRHHFGLRKVDGPAYSAWRVAQSLQKPPVNSVLCRPLKTLRLLLAPSPADCALDPEIAVTPTDLPTHTQITRSAADWRDDCSASDDEVAFMFFAGHGLQYQGEDCLACADFAATSTATNYSLDGCGTLSSLVEGMAGAQPGYAIARKQFWFADACRVLVDGISPTPVSPPRGFISQLLADGKPRDYPGLWATTAGAYASALPGEATAFTKALLHAFDGAVSQQVPWPDQSEEGYCWPVTMNSIRLAVAAQLRRDPRTAGQRPEFIGAGGDVPLLMYGWKHPPPFRARISVLPPGLPDGITHLSLRRIEGRPPELLSRPEFSPCPLEADLYAGTYEVRWTVGGEEVSRGWAAALGSDELVI